MNRILLLAVFASLLACAPLSVAVARPRPNVALAAQPHALKAEFGRDVLDTWVIPEQQGIRPMQVDGWHATLERGFHSAFDSAFGGSETWALKVERADLVLMPTIIGGGRVSTVQAQLTYRARLLDAGGKEVAVSAGTVESKTTASAATQQEMTRLAGDAVETMYEQVAAEFFATKG